MARKSNRTYFTTDTEAAIIEYNSVLDSDERDQIYESRIHPALMKLVENVIHKYKFYYYDNTYYDLQHEVVVYLHERLDKFSEGKGKAFSYFTIVARNYLIVRNRQMYEAISNKDCPSVIDDHRDVVHEVYSDDRRDMLLEFIRLWADWGIDNIEILFASDRDRQIAEAVFVLFKNCDDIDNFNKKALYILIREYANVKTQYITRVVRELKVLFDEMSIEYIRIGIIDWDAYLLEKCEYHD